MFGCLNCFPLACESTVCLAQFASRTRTNRCGIIEMSLNENSEVRLLNDKEPKQTHDVDYITMDNHNGNNLENGASLLSKG